MKRKNKMRLAYKNEWQKEHKLSVYHLIVDLRLYIRKIEHGAGTKVTEGDLRGIEEVGGAAVVSAEVQCLQVYVGRVWCPRRHLVGEAKKIADEYKSLLTQSRTTPRSFSLCSSLISPLTVCNRFDFWDWKRWFWDGDYWLGFWIWEFISGRGFG